MEPPERKEHVCEGYPDMDAHLMDNLGLLFIANYSLPLLCYSKHKINPYFVPVFRFYQVVNVVFDDFILI